MCSWCDFQQALVCILLSIGGRQYQRPTNELLHRILQVRQHQVGLRSGSIDFGLLAVHVERVARLRGRVYEGLLLVVYLLDRLRQK